MPGTVDDLADLGPLIDRIRAQADVGTIRLTQHAQEEMAEEDILLDEVLEAIANGQVLENYPEHRRGGCCLVNGTTQLARPVHLVCTTARPMLIIITAYEPKPPVWATPTERRQ